MRKNTLLITSNRIGPNSSLPIDYSYDGKNVNPPLLIKNLPRNTKSIAIIMKDTEIESRIHWVAYNIPAIGFVKENEKQCELGFNGFKSKGYSGPKPNGKVHTYVFRVYALDDYLYFPRHCVSPLDVEEGIRYHLLGYGELRVVYEGVSEYHLAELAR